MALECLVRSCRERFRPETAEDLFGAHDPTRHDGKHGEQAPSHWPQRSRLPIHDGFDRTEHTHRPLDGIGVAELVRAYVLLS